MKVLYLDLNDELIEDYSRNSNKYGGGRCVAAALMPFMNDNGHHMEIWADNKCFENVEEKYKKFCRHLTKEEKVELKNNIPLSKWAKDFDIVLHSFHSIKINCEGTNTKDVTWLVGYAEHVNPLNTRVILYNDYQFPRITNSNTKIYRARIGVSVPEYKEYEKGNYIFSCHRQALFFGSEIMMQLAHKYKFRYITAGPIEQSFKNIIDYIDNKYVTYLGVIDNDTKVDFYSHAYCSTSLHSWPTPFNLSACQSLAFGTPVIATNVGFWPSFIENGKNGFIVNTENDFMNALAKCSSIKPRDCYESVKRFSEENMIVDYMNVFNKILEE